MKAETAGYLNGSGRGVRQRKKGIKAKDFDLSHWENGFHLLPWGVARFADGKSRSPVLDV